MNSMSDERLSTKPHISCELGEEVVFLLDCGEYASLHSTGRRIWQLLLAGTSRAEICETLAREFDVSTADCAQDVDAFLEELSRAGLIDVRQE
jgi:hypothetical protein